MKPDTTSLRDARIPLALEPLEPRVLLSAGFGAQQLIATGTPSAASVFAADLDGDGDPDVLAASAEAGTIAWYENQGGGAFAPAKPVTTSSGGAEVIYAADLNGDGRLDVLSATYANSGGKIAWYENLGAGAFGPEHVITGSENGVYALTSADVDGDGDMDVLAAGYRTTWFANLGGGAFSERRVISSTAGLSITTGDLDGDGDADVLSSSLEVSGSYDFTEKVVWYANLGGGELSPKRTVSTSDSATYATEAADLDNDGDLDVLWLTPKRIEWSENLGGGNFAPKDVLAAPAPAEGVSGIAAADLDGDGLADIVAFGGRTLSWYRNLGGGSFGPEQIVVSDGAGSARAVDLDGDGALDLLAASTASGTIGWYRNLGDSAPAEEPGDYVGSLGSPNGGTVYVYDTIGAVDVRLSDVNVKFGKAGGIASITLAGGGPMEGVSLVVKGGLPTGITVRDARKGAVGDVGFIVSDAPIKGMKLKGGLAGGDVALAAQDLVALPDGLDSSRTAIYTDGWLGSMRLGGGVTGDLWIGGTDATGLAFKSLQCKSGDFDGHLRALGAGGSIAFGGVFRAGSAVTVDGLLKSISIGACETDNTGVQFGVFAGAFGKLSIGSRKLGGLDLPFSEGDFRVVAD